MTVAVATERVRLLFGLIAIAIAARTVWRRMDAGATVPATAPSAGFRGIMGMHY